MLNLDEIHFLVEKDPYGNAPVLRARYLLEGSVVLPQDYSDDELEREKQRIRSQLWHKFYGELSDPFHMAIPLIRYRPAELVLDLDPEPVRLIRDVLTRLRNPVAIASAEELVRRINADEIPELPGQPEPTC
jgi:hypothetical protein